MSDFTLGDVVNIASATSPLAITNTSIGSGPARLFGIYINTALSAHTLQIQDFNSSASPNVATTLATIPASAAAGTMYPFPGLEFRNQLRVRTSNAAATGNITVAYKPGTAASLLRTR